MTIIFHPELSVKEYAAAGKEVEVPRQACPRCASSTIFWYGYYRFVRSGPLCVLRIWVRRCRCKACVRTDAILPSFCLERRLDAVEVIGPAIVACSAGAGTRSVAKAIGELFSYTTVRSWWRRHLERRAWLDAVVFVAGLGVAAGVVTFSRGGDPLGALVGAATPPGCSEPDWQVVSALLGGSWLSTNTDMPTTGASKWPLMALTANHDARRPP